MIPARTRTRTRTRTPTPARALAMGAAVMAWALAGPAHAAFEFAGTRSIVAVTADGVRTPIGTVAFTPADGGQSVFRIDWLTDRFTDHFLSMREFKCLPAAKEITCHVPYPYPHPARVGSGQLDWLEHSLLFLHKAPSEFGAKLWNGVYFQFREQGDALVGEPMAVDLNEIAAPPKDPTVPPFRKALRHDMPAGARWVQQLVVQ